MIGFDAVDDARNAIAAGARAASVAQYPSEMGRLAVETAVKLMKRAGGVQEDAGTPPSPTAGWIKGAGGDVIHS